MNLPGWGTAAGFVTKWLDPILDRRKRLDRKIQQLEDRLKIVTGIKGKERVYADTVRALARLRKERDAIRD